MAQITHIYDRTSYHPCNPRWTMKACYYQKIVTNVMFSDICFSIFLVEISVMKNCVSKSIVAFTKVSHYLLMLSNLSL